MEEHHLKVERTARFYTHGTSAPEAKQFWIALHGYAQLAKDFAESLSDLVDEDTLLVAPEGLNRFYAKGFSGNPAANWMTSEDRLNEIEDYVNYLDKLAFEYFTTIPHNAQRHVLGFSQGCATLCRWLAKRRPHVDHVWLCAGSFPHDMDWLSFAEYIHDKELHLLVGNKDQFVTDEALNTVKGQLEQYRIAFDLHVFDGGHVVDVPTILKTLGK